MQLPVADYLKRHSGWIGILPVFKGDAGGVLDELAAAVMNMLTARADVCRADSRSWTTLVKTRL
jgi:hypothetical protein